MMANAKRLPSGSWRIRVFLGTDEDGHKITQSVTAETKRDAEMQAAMLKTQKRKISDNPTAHEAIRQYIDVRIGVLSPSTIRAYESLYRTAYDGIGSIRVQRLKRVDLQRWVSDYSADHSPKRVSNAWGLLRASLAMVDVSFNGITLPTKYRADTYTPSDGDVGDFLQYIKQTRTKDNDLYLAVMLAAYGCMRRSEICALTADDIDRKNGIVHVSKAMVKTEDRDWVVKMPKTPGSVRDVPLPKEIMDAIPAVKKGRVIQANPDQISHRFERAIKTSGVHRFRFHDLRHYAASTMHAWGVPDQYIMARGGWSSDYVMKRVYRSTISEEEKKINAEIAKRISKILPE